MTKNQSTKFIVYELRRPDGTPFYVGKGRRRRPRYHMEIARRGERSLKSNIIRSIERDGQAVSIGIVHETDDEAEALQREVRRIAELRVAGIRLTNRTDGGDGISGYRHTPQTRSVIAQASRNRVVREETRERLRAVNLGKTISQETRAKLSESVSRATKGKPKSPEHRSKMVARLQSEEMKAIALAAIVGRPCSAETRAKIGAANKGRKPWSAGKTRESPSEETRAKLRAANLGKKHSPESLAKMRESQKEAWTRRRRAVIVGQLPLKGLVDVD